ncbi:MAG: ISAs1 family transposase [Janthinobacterium lividum]
MLSQLFAFFATLPDPRCAGRLRHRFLNLLLIAVCAVVAGAETWVDIAHHGRMKHAWLAIFLDLPHGIPAPDTFRRVCSLVDPQGQEQCLRQGIATAASPLPREVVAIAGKTVRRSFDRGRGPLHIVSAFATQQGLSLGQAAVAGQGQELLAIPLLPRNLCLTNTSVTLDALGCQHAIARRLVARQAAYILALKGNQGRCHRAVVAYCKTACFDREATYPPEYDASDCRHGRWVRRRAWVLPLRDELAALRDWPGWWAILAVETIRHVQHQPSTHAAIRSYLTSCSDASAVLIAAIRRHWAIENSLH